MKIGLTLQVHLVERSAENRLAWKGTAWAGWVVSWARELKEANWNN